VGARPDIVLTIAGALAVIALLASMACIVVVTWLVRRERDGRAQFGDGGGAAQPAMAPADLGNWAYPLPLMQAPPPTYVAQPMMQLAAPQVLVQYPQHYLQQQVQQPVPQYAPVPTSQHASLPAAQYVGQPTAPQQSATATGAPQQASVAYPGLPTGSVVLSRPWPGIVEALESQLRHETDPVDRNRMAVDLGGNGNERSTQAVIAAVRDGIISPAAGAHAVADSSFDAGVAAGAAIADPDPRVRTFAGLVSQRLERTIHQ
jgi:hypothetical protein